MKRIGVTYATGTTTQEVLATTFAESLDTLPDKVDHIINTRKGKPLLASTVLGKKVCLKMPGVCANCGPDACRKEE